MVCNLSKKDQNMMYVFTGSRNWEDKRLVRECLCALSKDSVIVQGGAVGLDQMVALTAKALGFRDIRTFLPEWDKYGKPAGMVRNREMIELKPDWVFAFWRNRSKGTGNTIKLAIDAEIPITIYSKNS